MRLGTGQPGATLVTCILRDGSPRTQADMWSSQADRLYAASLVIAGATAQALLSGMPDRITLVAMGNNAVVRTEEDELCALHLRNLLEG